MELRLSKWDFLINRFILQNHKTKQGTWQFNFIAKEKKILPEQNIRGMKTLYSRSFHCLKHANYFIFTSIQFDVHA